MGIFGALTTSVAGLRANSYALENISGNIANSQTTAFKRIDTSFMDLIPDTGTNAQLAGSVTAGSRSTNTVAGSVQSAAVSTYMAINGDGFFAVQKPGSFSDNNPAFDGVNRYTRRGDFSLDKNGYLVNGAGYYLQGVPIDPITGNPSGSVPQVLRFQNDFLPSQATTKIDYRANLASYPLTNKHDTSVPGSELLRPADFISNPRILGTPATPFSNTAVPGNARNNYEAIPQPISTGTLLASAAGTNSLPAGFANGDTLVLKTTTGGVTTTNTLSFYTGAAPAPVAGTTFIDLATATVGGLLTTIDGLTGGSPASSVSAAGAITLNTGTANDFTLAAGASASAVAAFQALGFTGTVTGLRGGGGTAGTGIVIGSDNTAFLDEFDQRRHQHRLRRQRGSSGLAIQMGQSGIGHTGRNGYLELVLSGQSRRHRQHRLLAKRRHRFQVRHQRPDAAGCRPDHIDRFDGRRHQPRQCHNGLRHRWSHAIR